MPAKDKSVDNKSKDDKSMPGMDMPTDPKPGKNNTPSNNTISQTIKQATFGVSGNCEMCKDRIEEAAKSVKGVTTAVWDVKSKKINIEYNNALTSTENVQKAIARVGDDSGKYKADDKVYNSLPACCKYWKS